MSKYENNDFGIHKTDAKGITVLTQIGNRLLLSDTENAVACAVDNKLQEIAIVHEEHKWDPASFFPVNR